MSQPHEVTPRIPAIIRTIETRLRDASNVPDGEIILPSERHLQKVFRRTGRDKKLFQKDGISFFLQMQFTAVRRLPTLSKDPEVNRPQEHDGDEFAREQGFFGILCEQHGLRMDRFVISPEGIQMQEGYALERLHVALTVS